jgi:hypothetical protein
MSWSGAMKEIPLHPTGKGLVALVDDEDFDRVGRFKWFTIKPRNVAYAVSRLGDWQGPYVYMHRFVLGDAAPARTDHENGNGLDNRRSNLRPSTASQNGANAMLRRGKSPSKGVNWCQASGKWVARIRVNYRRMQLGRYQSEEAAARAYDGAALHFWGAFARTNFPDSVAGLPRRACPLGVSWHSAAKKWRARIGPKHLGVFENQEEAARAFDRAALELQGAAAKLNFPRTDYVT